MDSLVTMTTLVQKIPVHERIEVACEMVSQTPEYKTARAEVLRIWDDLGVVVVPETKGLLIQYESVLLKLCDIESTACYLQGMADGAANVAAK